MIMLATCPKEWYNGHVMKEISPVSTDIVYQHNEISWAAHELPLYLRRFVTVAMARIKKDKDLHVTFTVVEAMKALHMNNGTRVKKTLVEVFKNAGKQVIQVRKEGEYTVYPWFSKITLSETNDTVDIKFNPELAPIIRDFKTRFAVFTLEDFGKLKSQYAQKLFDIVISQKGHIGKRGNSKGAWFVDFLSIEELRKLFSIKENEYKDTTMFRRKVIDSAVKQLNEADIGFSVETESKYVGKSLKAIKFNCRDKERLRVIENRTVV